MNTLYWLVTITDRPTTDAFLKLYKSFGVDVSLRTVGAGTAVQETLSTLGLEKTEKAVLFAIITADSWPRIQKALRRQMRIDVPGTGIAFIVPVSSIGGKRALLFLTEHQTLELKEESTLKDTRYDLLLVIANQGYTGSIMDAARAAGAGGGTVIHAKGVHLGPAAHQMEKRGVETFLGNLNRDIRAANSLMQSIRSAIRGLQRWIADLNEKKQILLDALEKAKEPTLSDLLVDYFNLRNEQRSDWSGKAKLKCTVRDFEEVKRAVDYLKAHSLDTVEDLNQAIDSLNQTAAPLRGQLKQNENRMRAIAQIKDAAAVHAKLKPIHDTFIKKNFKLTKDAYAAQHKEELDTFNKAVRTLMKLNGNTAVDFSALNAEFSALQSGSAELRTQLETLQPDVSALKNIRKYIDMVLNKQQLSAPGGKTPEKESVLKQLEQLQQKKSNYKTISTTPNREESL